MDTINYFFGKGEDLNILQMSMRAFITFVMLLILIRVAGFRTFAKGSSFDSIIVIMLGAIIARGVVGASPYWPTVAASVVMVVMHRFIAWLSVKNKKFEKLVKGEHVTLYQDGALVANNLERTGMSEKDIHESLRLETKKSTLEEVDCALVETNGRISFIFKRE